MKTRANHFFKALSMALFISLTIVGCGKDDKSGKKKNNGSPTVPGINNAYNYGAYNLPSNWLEIVAQENPCQLSGTTARVSIATTLQGLNINAGAIYAGVTPEGDIGIITNQNGNPTLEVLACDDLAAAGTPTVFDYSFPVLNVSDICPISEITDFDVVIQTTQGQAILEFAPIAIPGARASSLCQNY